MAPTPHRASPSFSKHNPGWGSPIVAVCQSYKCEAHTGASSCQRLQTLPPMQLAGIPNLWPGTKACKPSGMVHIERDKHLSGYVQRAPSSHTYLVGIKLRSLSTRKGWPSKSDVVGFALSQGDGHTQADQD